MFFRFGIVLLLLILAHLSIVIDYDDMVLAREGLGLTSELDNDAYLLAFSVRYAFTITVFYILGDYD